jgi:hypothetical protein
LQPLIFSHRQNPSTHHPRKTVCTTKLHNLHNLPVLRHPRGAAHGTAVRPIPTNPREKKNLLLSTNARTQSRRAAEVLHDTTGRCTNKPICVETVIPVIPKARGTRAEHDGGVGGVTLEGRKDHERRNVDGVEDWTRLGCRRRR